MLFRRLEGLKAYKTETTGARVRLSSNELPYELPEPLKREVSRALLDTDISRYPDPDARELKSALAEFFGVGEENILLGNGSDEIIYYLSAVVGDGGVLICPPTFAMYEISARVMGRDLIQVSLDQDFDIDLQASMEAINSFNPSLVYYAYPNNPTGNLFSRSKIITIRERGVFTVVDEAYYHYSGQSFLDDALSRSDTLVLRTLSKIGMAGLRVGILIGREDVISELEKVRLPFNISTFSQITASLVLRKGREFIEESVSKVISERERLYRQLSAISHVEVFPSKANFILFRTPWEAGRVHRALIEEGVLIRDVSYMDGLKRCLRVSVGTPEENDAFLDALDKVLRRLQ